MTDSQRERRAKEIVQQSGADTVEHFERVVLSRTGVAFKEQAKVWYDMMSSRKSKMLKGKIFFEDSKSQWLLQLADFAANTWAQTIGDYDGRNGFQGLFPDLYRKSALPDATPIGVVAPTDKTEVVSAPEYLEVFARMAHGLRKILPCD